MHLHEELIEIARNAHGAFIEHAAEWRRIERDQLEPGDVLVLKVLGLPIHCGLVLGAETMLHCMRGRDTVKEQFTSFAWARRIEGAYRWT